MAALKIENLITEHLDLWTAAVRPKSSAGRGASSKLELTGIKKLRELILELAVRGKLVSQDPCDEPASVLLERIAAEKARLVKEGKLKKPKALPEISEEEQYFDLPSTWSWVRLNDIADYNGRPNIEPNNIKGDVWLLDLEDIEKDTSKLLYRAFYEERESKSNKSTFKCGDVLYGKLRPYLNKVIIADLDGVCTTEIVPIVPGNGLHPAYLKYLLKSPAFQRYVNSLMYGVKMPRLGTEDAIKSVHPLPPLAEQHRIVAKVDELMALCDQLELRSESQLAAHQTLVETLLATLTDCADADELAQNWARLSTHFDTLFTSEASIDALKQTILQLAVMGKLVPQDPSDEPASALLARIAAEKARLVKEKKIKKEKPLPAISEEEKPFELPKGWEWCRFGALVNFRAELVKPENFPSFDQVAPDSIEKGTGKLIKRRTVLESGVKGPNSRFYAGQILYSKIRPSLSKAIIANFDGLCSADMYPLDAMISSDFLLKVILSEVFLAQVRVAENRIKMPKLNVDSLSSILVPVCPSSEMNRITSKITELILVCDQLQSRLQTSQQTQLALAESLVEGALA
ncbi:MAG: restriction endonuclease subunit S [Shewanella sp.]